MTVAFSKQNFRIWTNKNCSQLRKGGDKMSKKGAVEGCMNGTKRKHKRRKVNKRQWPLHNLQLNCDGGAAIFHVVEMCTNVFLFLCLLWLRNFCLSFSGLFLFLPSTRSMCRTADVTVFQKAEHYNESNSSVSQPTNCS